MPAGPTGVDPTADSMLDAARQGSNRAWAALLERLDPRCRTLTHVVLGGHNVDDTLLVAYVRAYRARRKGSSDAVVFLTHHVWVACGHEVRRRQRRAHPAPGRRAERGERPPRLGRDPLARAVADLRPEERAVWALLEHDDLSVEVIADALGVDSEVIIAVADRLDEQVEATVADSTAEHHLDMAEVDGAEVDAEESDRADEADEAPDIDVTRLAEIIAGDEVEVGDGTDEGQLDPDPPHAGFWEELGHRLRAERHALPAAPPPNLPDQRAPSDTTAPPEPSGPPDTKPRRGRRRTRSSRTELAAEADRQSPRRHWPSVLVRVAAVVAALAIVGAAIVTLYMAASNARAPVRGESTADRARQSMDVLADADTWSATVEQIVMDEKGARQRATVKVATDADGSYRVENTTIGRITTYDARFGVLRDTLTGFPPRDELGVAPGAPDPTVPRSGFPMDDLATAARVLEVEDDEAPEETELNGRKVWRLEGDLEDDLTVTYLVDASSLAPVRVTWTKGDRTVRELRFRDVALGVDAPPFTQELPADLPPAQDRGFVPVALGEVRGRIDLKPLTPGVLPPGFELTGSAWVHEAMRVVSLRYARGPQQIIVTLRPSPVEAGRPWDDPFDREGQEVDPQEVTLETGPFRDETAQMVSGGRALPSIWAADGETAFTVAGDLSTDQLLEVAQSLR